ncbi:SAM-dependent methyltransferase [Hahella sp. CCB-MM4]|uniref:class I SAM-dependent methyltransferase n=1 Tax=Hahella sp. (strain CCB-MM4) TaxID=1926491 RepID=UPI000B9BF52D|nr:methyltransferase domain-containing protein [Hahella sp. CCB-MM4]OZG73639.1 SAM-dependent methyltransferase [Hahella sp. CCB-MM4]
MKNISKLKMLDPGSVREDFRQWFGTGLGRSLLASQRLAVERCISRYFGYHQLELLVDQDHGIAENSLLGHRIVAVPKLEEEAGDGVLVCEPHELPLVSDSIDLVVLHHTLDLSPQPHQALREACRVLRSGGHIVIVGFNPVSTWGLSKYLHRSRKAPWSGRFISAVRLEDWLNLLDLQLHEVNYSFYTPPAANLRWLSRLAFLNRLGKKLKLPLGAFYIIQAQKRVGGVIPLKPKWQRRAVTGNGAAVVQFTPYRKNEKS